ncbi:hypothetical protein [Streptomyces europaeiscabiei]|uniref:hypothetical protein n=1 Tax=Streptomyces europaeiscabiei TaxID=146819 RepID=UPI002E14107B|nr:hypothetical protein OHB30_16640 [Streptomyces europaeiscabiei]
MEVPKYILFALLALIPGVIGFAISAFNKYRFMEKAQRSLDPAHRERESTRADVMLAVFTAVLGLIAALVSGLLAIMAMNR